MRGRLASLLKWRTNTLAISANSPHRQANLLAWILVFLILFCIVTLLIVLVFDPHHDLVRNEYVALISGVVVLLLIAYILNRAQKYQASAIVLVSCAAIVPWASLVFDPSILEGDIIPLTYVTFSVLLSSIFLPASFTFTLAVSQFTAIILVFLLSPSDASLNWFSFLAFLFLTSMFALLANNIIQQDMMEILNQAQQLTLNEALLKEQVIRDDLTGLHNRRYLNEMFEREIQRAFRSRSHLCIVILDVDDFKYINDTFGHITGDAVLRELGTFLGHRIRKYDIACRYGGDEFVLVFPDTSQATAIERVEQLQEGMKKLNLPVPVTTSAGVAIFPENGADGETLLQAADHALYQAKDEGCDCVIVAGQFSSQHTSTQPMIPRS